MKKPSSLIALMLVFAFICCLLGGCGIREASKIRQLTGSWVSIMPDSEENALFLLEGIGLYEEEIALVDLSSLNEAILVEFRKDHTYRFCYDLELLRNCVQEFYLGVFASLYENRTSLNDLYEMDFSSLSEEEFRQFYAILYDYADFSSLIQAMTDMGYDYESLSADLENGTYTIKGSQIFCTVTGQHQEESLGYRIVGNQLILIYSDVTEYYTRK